MKFQLWSFLHYFMMISPFIIAYVLYLLTQKKDMQVKRRVGIFLSAVTVVLLLLRNIEIFIIGNFAFDFEIIPLQICHFANFVLLFCFL